jgi:uncharacterized membrane protein
MQKRKAEQNRYIFFAAVILLLLLLILAATVLANNAGSYEITRYHAGSGGTISGGAHTMHTTIGQSEASILSGHGYTVGGGFWGGGAVQQFSYEIFLPSVSSPR